MKIQKILYNRYRNINLVRDEYMYYFINAVFEKEKNVFLFNEVLQKKETIFNLKYEMNIYYFIFLKKVFRKVLQYIIINSNLFIIKRNKFERYF